MAIRNSVNAELLVNGVQVANAAGTGFNSVVLADGQLVLGSSGAQPVAATLAVSNGLAGTAGAGSYSIAGVQATETAVGVVELATSAEAIAGADTQRAVVPSALSAKLGAQTANALPVAAGPSNAMAYVGPLTNGQVLLGSTGNAPVAGTISASNGLQSTAGAGSLAIAGVQATDAAVGVVELATNAEAIAGTDTQRAIVPSALAAKLGAQTANAIALGAGSTAALSYLGPLTNGQLIIGNTGNAPATAQLTAGAGIAITNGAGSISISATGSSTWQSINANVTAAASTGYFVTANAVSIALPATSSVGDSFEVALAGGTSWTITQGAGQQIFFGNISSTSGTGGSVVSTASGDCVRLVCRQANTAWQVVSSMGNLTVN